MDQYATILRRRAFRDGYSDGKKGKPMRRQANKRLRWLYALGRMFANCTAPDVRLYEQRNVNMHAVTLFASARSQGFLRA